MTPTFSGLVGRGLDGLIEVADAAAYIDEHGKGLPENERVSWHIHMREMWAQQALPKERGAA